jgi:putative tryptophan/tyrosine transport system substrate-binding protein
MRRREFIGLVGAAAAWPLVARAQHGERMRRIGVLLNVAEDDPESLTRVTAFAQGLQELGWVDGRNVRIDFRWGGADVERIRRYAAESVALAPDVVVSSGTPAVAALEQVTSTMPIVFVQVPDPVGSGHVESLARPGGNATGFATFEYGFGGKWLELLKEISPHVTRAAVLRDVTIAAGSGQFGAIQSMAPSLGVEIKPCATRPR